MADAKTVAQPYLDLQERLAKNPVGAPPADELFEIFQILFTEEEALVASRMPMRPAPFDDVLTATGMDRDRLTALLDSMADKGLVIDIESRGEMRYILAPPVIGFMEYTFMKRNEHLPMKRLAELANSYISNHLSQEVAGSQTERTRVVPYESAFGEMIKEVLTYEQASEMIKDAGRGALTTCFCRREAQLRGCGCDAPADDICMGLGRGADYLVRRGFARPASVDELLAKLDETEELGLVHTSDNVREKAVFMCHCCGCCCHILRGITELNLPKFAAPSSFIACVDREHCAGCGVCEERCQVAAVIVNDEKAVVKTDRCLGCGVCISACPTDALSLERRDTVVEPPRNFMDLHVRIAAEKDRLKYFM